MTGKPYFIMDPGPAYQALVERVLNIDDQESWYGLVTISYTEGKLDHKTLVIHGVMRRNDFHRWVETFVHAPQKDDAAGSRTVYQEGDIIGWYQSWVTRDRGTQVSRYHSVSVSWVDEWET